MTMKHCWIKTVTKRGSRLHRFEILFCSDVVDCQRENMAMMMAVLLAVHTAEGGSARGVPHIGLAALPPLLEFVRVALRLLPFV